jgi:type IV pilus assembly protein PilW
LLFNDEATKCYGYIDYNGVRFFSLDSAEISSSACNDVDFCYIAVDTNYNIIEANNTSNSYCYDITDLPSDDIYLLFGLSESYNSSYPANPYNEVEYYLSSSSISRCADNTYTLLRKDREGTQPILDCVKGFKVGFGLDTDGDGDIDTWDDTLPTNATMVREQVREVRIVILYHEGKRDIDYDFSGSLYFDIAPTLTYSPISLTSEDRHYRWKMMRLAVSPMNFRRVLR